MQRLHLQKTTYQNFFANKEEALRLFGTLRIEHVPNLTDGRDLFHEYCGQYLYDPGKSYWHKIIHQVAKKNITTSLFKPRLHVKTVRWYFLSIQQFKTNGPLSLWQKGWDFDSLIFIAVLKRFTQKWFRKFVKKVSYVSIWYP